MYTKNSFVWKIAYIFMSWYNGSLLKKGASICGAFVSASAVYRSIQQSFGRKPSFLYSQTKNMTEIALSWLNKLADKIYYPFEKIFKDSLLGKFTYCFVLANCEKWCYIISFFALIDYFLRIKNPFWGQMWVHALIVLLLLFCIFKWFMCRRDQSFKWSPVDIPILIYFAANLVAVMANPYDFDITLTGVRANIEYIFWFFIVFLLLKTEKGAKNILTLMVAVATAVAMHGVYQYIIKVEMPPSWIDSMESGIRTRAFSVTGSPNVLGSYMALICPIGLSLTFLEKRLLRKLFYLGATLLMLLCLLVTFSRGAWIGFAFGILLYVFIKDRRFIFPSIILGLCVILFVPSIGNRISYMLSNAYIQSSLSGGRLIRWIQGMEMFQENPLFGVGPGHFGGAVAANFQIPNTFYMDNYYLKTAVEMGFVGLSGFVFLMAAVAVWGLKAILTCQNVERKEILTGTYCGLFAIIIHNFFENIFEVPMMVTYFFVIAAVCMHLWHLEYSSAS